MKTDNKILDFGCGKKKRPNAIGIDRNPRSDADVIHDLNHFPYPFPDSTFDEIYCDNILEHLDDVVQVMVELHRISKPNGLIEITVPFFPHRNANTDPTHKHWFGVHSFDYFINGTSLSEFHYSPVQFTLQSAEFDMGITHRHFFDTLLALFANKNKDFYENRLANIFPLAQLTFRLMVAK
jgi:ubiquinone/menaquinone biosynthesis C-methylase UbiE